MGATHATFGPRGNHKDRFGMKDGLRFLSKAAPELAPYVQRASANVRLVKPGFASLCRIVVEQSISLKAAEAIWHRIEDQLGPVTPEKMAEQETDRIRSVGLSKAKATCLQNMAQEVASERLNIDAMATLSDDEVRKQLCALRGIGRWTADIYLLLGLSRQDVWPAHDLALREGLRIVFDLPTRPSPKEADQQGEALRPHRSLATFALWDAYLERKRS